MSKEWLYKVYSWIIRVDKKYKKLSVNEKTDISIKELEAVFPNNIIENRSYPYSDPTSNIWLTTDKSEHLDKVPILRDCIISIQIADNFHLDYINGSEIVILDIYCDKTLTRTPKLKGAGWRKGKYSDDNQYIDRELIFKIKKEVPEDGIEIKDLNEYYELYRRILYNEGKYLKLRRIN